MILTYYMKAFYFSIIILLYSYKGLSAEIKDNCLFDEIKSPKTRVSLIELYTSEGCSSCPPAEKWLNSLLESKGIGIDFFPLAFHVNYWDYIGWKDPYAKNSFTKRQRTYSRIWKAKNIYTPGVVLNGLEWRNWRSGHHAQGEKEQVGILKSRCLGNNVYKVSFDRQSKNTNLNYALIKNGLVSRVNRGENAGRTLHHNFVVLDHQKVPFEEKVLKVDLNNFIKKDKGNILVFWLDDKKTLIPIQLVSSIKLQ